jgi:hypothetical protein
VQPIAHIKTICTFVSLQRSRNKQKKKMKPVITAANFADFKIQILNACSIFGNINHPDTWSMSLTIFDFDEVGEDLAASLLTDSYFAQLKSFKF